jgi:PHD/YefM family antitoxin component YafN of YafNO toxin-antitoxin module
MDTDREIHPLTDFTRNTPDFVEQLRATGEPMVLTIEGKAAIVVQEVASYQKIADLAEEARVVDGIRRGLEDIEAGRTQPLAETFADIRRELGIPTKSS